MKRQKIIKNASGISFRNLNRKGPRVDLMNHKGMNIIHLLVSKGEFDFIPELVKIGADITNKDELGETVLFHGIGFPNSYKLLVNIFLASNGDIDAQNIQGVS